MTRHLAVFVLALNVGAGDWDRATKTDRDIRRLHTKIAEGLKLPSGS